MNAQRAYEYINKTHEPSDSVSFLKGLIEALTGEVENVEPPVEPPVKVGDRVMVREGCITDGIGEVCYIEEYGDIRVGFDATINRHGWQWERDDRGYEYAQKRGFKYWWPVTKGHYTIIGRA